MEQAGKIEFSRDKFKELVLYIAERSEDDPYFGAIKLNKILLFSDFFAYGNLGRPITGATYRALRRGPAPKELVPIRSEMVKEGSLAIRHQRMLRFTQKRPIALREADETLFSAAELALVNEVIEALEGRTAFQTSEVSHATVVGWQLAKGGQEIPYSAVFLSPRRPTERHFARAREIVEKHGFSEASA